MREPRAKAIIAAAFFAYVVWMRTHDVADAFLMLGEQIRDWTIALGPWQELPLTGAPSTAGGRGFGPIYYWVLWIGRISIGPFTNNLPHAGGIAVAVLQSAADTFLLWLLWRRVGFPLALAACLFIASAPFDISISSVIWNPPVSAALVKIATGLALALPSQLPVWKIGVTAGVSWLAVQAHSSAIFLAAPLIAALMARSLVARDWPGAINATVVCLAVILGLQVPWFVSQLRGPEAALGPTAALESMSRATSFQFTRSYSAVVNTTGELLVDRKDQWRFQLVYLAAALVVVSRWRKDPMLIAVSVGPIAAATVLFATWTRPYDSYWFLTVTTAMTLTFGFAMSGLPWTPVRTAIGIASLLAVLVAQPARIAQSKAFFSYPQYRAMRIGSTELARLAPVVRDIHLTFEAHPTMDRYFIYKILGGRVDSSASQTAFIDADGSARIQ